MSLEKINHIIDHHQRKADFYHEQAKIYYAQGLKVLCVETDMKAHKHEASAMSLRLKHHV